VKQFILFLLPVLVCTFSAAQENRKFIVKEGARPRDVFTFNDIYLFPAFNSGVVRFRNNTVGNGMMNYNCFTAEIDFINGKDTLELADPETIKSITIGKNIFYYQVDIGYIQYVTGTDYGTFGKMETYQVADRRRQRTSDPSNYFVTPGSSGGVNAGTPAAKIGGLSNGSALSIIEHVDIIYKKSTEYFFANKNGFFVTPNKKNITRIFPKKKNAISAYLANHNVDFDNEESLQNLFTVITAKQ
jgi:hypothetical protein